MLNELFQVAEALKNLGVASKEAHPSMKPMGKSPLLIVRLSNSGRIASVDILPAEHGDSLKRIEHGSAGTSFPGFNLPSPVLDLSDVPSEKLKEFAEIQKDRKASGKQRLDALRNLASLAQHRSFSDEQERQFNRIFHEFVPLIASDFTEPFAGVEAFVELLGILKNHPPTMKDFVSDLIAQVTRNAAMNDALLVKIVENFLVGKLAFKGVANVGSSMWWQQKRKEDKKGKTALFVDLDSPPSSATVVAHSRTCEMIESHLLKVRPGRGYAKSGKGAKTRNGIDAFTGETGELTTSFPEPREQVLRPPDLKLFSASSETQCLERYGLIESAIFPVSKLQSARMQNAILKLAAKKEQRGNTWFPIPSSLNEKKKPKSDLLVAYLEGEPEGRATLAEMFGGEMNSFADADFEAIAQPVLEMLEGKLAANPNLNVRLLAFCPIDKAKKQISLNRSLRVLDVIRAARDWEMGAHNVPEVSVRFDDKKTKQPAFRSHTAPCPLELASVANRVWNSDAKNGFNSSYQRAISVGDAYDVFLADTPLAKQKAQTALGLIISRMSIVLVALGSVKTTRKWTSLSDAVRWQSVKSIALLGILLHQLGHKKINFMQEPITQVGRLLALADSLHQQYCKHVRKGESPSQLIGNALFNTALDQPVFALARLAERLTPYQAWARTFQSSDPEAGVGLVKYFLSEIAACTAAIHVVDLPQRMSDADKAKLLLGYLADHPKNETPKH